jgi:hypothetical protein
MFEQAFASRIPIIGVQTDDLINFQVVLQHLTNHEVAQYTSPSQKLGPKLYWTDNLDDVDVKLYNKLLAGEHQLVVVNADKKSSLVFEAGTLPTPPEMVKDYLIDVLGPDAKTDELLEVLKGLSLKSVGEIVMLTQARTGGTLPSEVRRTRTMVGGGVQGLYSLDTSYDFYEYPPVLQEWLVLNFPYFADPKTHPKLVPRGLLMDGPPGTGKTMGAKAVANYLKVPLYRLDIATTLNKYIGESENRISRSLMLVDREAPCVLLIDEVEKLFGTSLADNGVTDRLLSQLLWWMSEHTSRVITIMTTNDKTALPPELYRQGRVDLVLDIKPLNFDAATGFAIKVFKSVVGMPPDLKQLCKMKTALQAMGESPVYTQPTYAHARVASMVYQLIKAEKWA